MVSSSVGAVVAARGGRADDMADALNSFATAFGNLQARVEGIEQKPRSQ